MAAATEAPQQGTITLSLILWLLLVLSVAGMLVLGFVRLVMTQLQTVRDDTGIANSRYQ